jgi:hypothetical protein
VKIQSQYADVCTTKATIEACCTTFGTVSQWASEQGGHFAYTFTQAVARQLKVTHRWTTAYAPWTDGTVEVVCRSVLKALQRLCSYCSMSFVEWAEVFPIF